MSLSADESEGEQIELRSLQAQLETTQQLVKTLSHQLTQLKDQVSKNIQPLPYFIFFIYFYFLIT